jgi:prepilin-type N-terminal cleavage/methylation domain-containing protein
MYKKKGLTLIEILIVITIISTILATIILPRLNNTKFTGRFINCQANLKTISQALEMYADSAPSILNKYPPAMTNLLTAGFIKVMPSCITPVPPSPRDTHTSSYTVSAQRDVYTFYCSGSNHTEFNTAGAANYPQYTSSRGMLIKPGKWE